MNTITLVGKNTLILHDPLMLYFFSKQKPEYNHQHQTACGGLRNRQKEDLLAPEQHHYSFITCRILVVFPVCLWCPDMKHLVMFPDCLDWCWRHMGLIRLFNLSSVTMPRIRRLIEFADGLSWCKMFGKQFSNYFCMSCPLWQMCVYVSLHLCVCVFFLLWLGASDIDRKILKY